MKFWELTFIMQAETSALEACLRRPEWAAYYDWYMNFNSIVDAQDRAKLDAPMPDVLVRDVLRGSHQVFFLGGGLLRSRRSSKEDQEMTALEAFERFGSKALEEALEYGSFRATPQI